MKNTVKISEKKLLANQSNSHKSTGPRTPRGKNHSRRNSLKHGLLARTVMFDANGKPDGEFLAVYEALQEQYATADVGMRMRLDLFFAEYWRLVQATRTEADAISKQGGSFLVGDCAQKLQRYMTASRNAFMKILDVLENAKGEQAEEEATEAGEEQPAPELCEEETQPTEAPPTKPISDIEMQTSIEETGAALATQLPPRKPAKTSGQDQPLAAPDDREGVPQPDLPPGKSAA